jgi:hypothetical protein
MREANTHIMEIRKVELLWIEALLQRSAGAQGFLSKEEERKVLLREEEHIQGILSKEELHKRLAEELDLINPARERASDDVRGKGLARAAGRQHAIAGSGAHQLRLLLARSICAIQIAPGRLWHVPCQ